MSTASCCQYFFEANLNVPRIRWITHVWTVVSGNTVATESGSPFSPSQTRKKTSRTPRFFNSVNTASQYFALSPEPWVPAHNPNTSRRPFRSTPIAT